MTQRDSPTDYKLIEAYHRETGALDTSYMLNLQRRAASQGQPLDVVFEQYDAPGEWRRLEELPRDLRDRVKRNADAAAKA